MRFERGGGQAPVERAAQRPRGAAPPPRHAARRYTNNVMAASAA